LAALPSVSTYRNVGELCPQGRDHERKQKRDASDSDICCEFPPQFFHLSITSGHTGKTLGVGHTSWLTLIKQGDETLEDNGAYDLHFHGGSRTAQSIF
jgi:hypothetical protein